MLSLCWRLRGRLINLSRKRIVLWSLLSAGRGFFRLLIHTRGIVLLAVWHAICHMGMKRTGTVSLGRRQSGATSLLPAAQAQASRRRR